MSFSIFFNGRLLWFNVRRCCIPVFLDFMHSSLDVPFPSPQEATIALRSLSPDREPRKGGISKELSVSGSTLSVWERLLEYDQKSKGAWQPCHTLNPGVSVFTGGGVQMKPGSCACPWRRFWIICRSCWKPWRCSDHQLRTEAWLMLQRAHYLISSHPLQRLNSGATSVGEYV